MHIAIYNKYNLLKTDAMFLQNTNITSNCMYGLVTKKIRPLWLVLSVDF